MYRTKRSRCSLLTVLAVTCVFLLPAGTAAERTNSLLQQIGQRPAHGYDIASSGLRPHRVPEIVLYPGCGSGVSDSHVVATYEMERAPVGSGQYRTSTLYCGNSSYGFRHLEPHVGQYFGGWGSFNFSITQTQRAPASITFRASNDTYTRAAPIYQCFSDYYIIWTFYVVTTGDSRASIITAYGSKGQTVNSSCP
jgi:hypothetical protein